MGEGIGGLLFEGAEKIAESNPAVRKLGQQGSQHLIDFVNHSFTLDSKLTGEGGTMIKEMNKAFGDRADYHLSKAVTAAKTLPPTIQPEPHLLRTQAVQKAREDVYGSKHQNLAVALHKIRQEHGVFGDEKAKEIADHMSIFFHDKAYDLTDKQGRKIGETSQLTKDLSSYKMFKGINFPVSKYAPPTKLEKVGRSVATGAFAYKAAAAHGVQGFLNSMANARASSQIKAMGELFGKGYPAAKAQLIASHAAGDLYFREYAQMWNYRGGFLSKYLPDSVGEFIHKNYMIPGITAARNINMIYSGLVGKYEAQYAAHAMVNGMEKRGSQALSLLGLDYRNIQARGGVLTKAEQEQAMRYMIDNNMFRDRESARTKFSASSPFGRLFTIFHNYTNMQSRLIFESTRRNLFQLHDLPMFFQQLAALAVVVPTVGNAIYSIDQAWTGKNEHPFDNFVGREKAIYSGHGAAEILESIGHMGGFGFAYGTVQAAGRQRLANYILGAPVSAGIELGEDATKGIHNTPEHPHQADQFYRDILHDIPSMGAGGWLANKYLPTRAQRDANRPMTVHRAKAAMKRKKKTN